MSACLWDPGGGGLEGVRVDKGSQEGGGRRFKCAVCSISLTGWASNVFMCTRHKTIQLMLEPGSLVVIM